MSAVLLVLGVLWLILGFRTFLSAWFGELVRLDLPPGATEPEKLIIKLQVAEAIAVELIIAVLLDVMEVTFESSSMTRWATRRSSTALPPAMLSRSLLRPSSGLPALIVT